MAPPKNTSFLDRMLTLLAESLTLPVAEKIAQLEPDPELQARIDELADKCTEGELTEAERIEYESYVRGAEICAMWKAQARPIVVRQSGS